MITQLPAIKQHIDTALARPDLSDRPAEGNDFDHRIASVETSLYTVFKGNPDRTALWDAQNFHVDLVQLIDEYTTASRPIDTPLLDRLLQLLEFCEQKFKVPLDLQNRVPLVYAHRALGLIRQHETAIAEALRDKHVNAVLIEKISHGFRLLLGREPATMHYATYRYLHQYLPALAVLSQSNLQKDWNLRLFRFFIQYNYNHMGVYNWWERETEQALQGKEALGELEHIHKLRNHIEHVDQKTDLGFETWRKPLKAQLLAYLDRRRALLTDRKMLRDALETRALVVNLPADEHNIHFNQDFEAGVYNAYASKKEASEAYARVIRGPEGIKLSAHSLRKSDTAKYYGAADRVEESLSDKRDAVTERFGLLLSSRKRSDTLNY